MNGNIYTIGDQYYKHNVKYPLNNFKDLTIGKSDGTVSEVLFEQTEPMIFKNTLARYTQGSRARPTCKGSSNCGPGG